MENLLSSQPLDRIMNEQRITSAQLVQASTEQLTFKMVQKGRSGKHLTPNIQDKILNALLKLKPDLKIRRRDLFRYEMSQESVEAIKKAAELVAKKKIKYPQYIDCLREAGVTRYRVEVASHQVIFYGSGGEAYSVQGFPVSDKNPGAYSQHGVETAIFEAQKGKIDYPVFLQKIYESGITEYEVNVRERKIVYRGREESYRENIPVSSPEPALDAVKPKKPASGKAEKSKKAKNKKPGVVRTTRKARLTRRKIYFSKKRKRRAS